MSRLLELQRRWNVIWNSSSYWQDGLRWPTARWALQTMNSRTKRDLLVRRLRPLPPDILTKRCRQSMSSPRLDKCDVCTYLVMLACCLKPPSQLTCLGCLMLQLVLMRNCSPVMLLHQAKTSGVQACSCSIAETVQAQRRA